MQNLLLLEVASCSDRNTSLIFCLEKCINMTPAPRPEAADAPEEDEGLGGLHQSRQFCRKQNLLC